MFSCCVDCRTSPSPQQNLRQNQCSSYSCRHLTALKSLTIKPCQLQPRALQALTQLQELSLREVFIDGHVSGFIRVMSELTRLTHLDLDFGDLPNVTTSAAVDLALKLTALKQLTFDRLMGGHMDPSLLRLTALTGLDKLIVMSYDEAGTGVVLHTTVGSRGSPVKACPCCM